MRRLLPLLALLALGCKSENEKELDRCKAEIDGFRYGSLSYEMERFDSCDFGLRDSKFRDALRGHFAASLKAHWPAIRQTQLGFAAQGTPKDQKFASQSAKKRAEVLAALADPDLDKRFAELDAELRAAEAKADAARAGDARGKTLIWMSGFEDDDLFGCVLAPLKAALPGVELTRLKEAPPEVVRAAAKGWVEIKADVEYTQYEKSGGGRGGIVPSRVSLVVVPHLPDQKGLPASWSASVAADNPETIAANQTADLMLARVQTLFPAACRKIEAEIRR
jgi:hypothetical protein